MAPSQTSLAAVAAGSFAAGAAAWALGGKRLLAKLKEEPAPTGPAQKGRVPIFVMMPLDTVTEDGNSVKDLAVRKAWLQGLAKSGVQGVMVDVWWGLCETKPGQYNFAGYLELCKILKGLGLKLQAVMSFHQCGGNVGDSVTIPVPSWALEPARAAGLLYQDRDARVSEDCLSLSADKQAIFPGKGGAGKRDALTLYKDYMAAFAGAFAPFLGTTVVEIQVGMGPCGELRYPSYQLSQGWNYPGTGLIMAHDAGMQKMLAEAAKSAGKPGAFGKVPVSAPTDTCGSPQSCALFSKVGAGDAHRTGAHGAFFLAWYHSTLLAHGEAVLRAAFSAFPKMEGLAYSVKVSGIHWHCMHPSRAAEACAGYAPSPETGTGAYLGIAKMLRRAAKEANAHVFFNFTCLEMSNVSQGPGMPQADSSPEDLIAEVRRACVQESVPLCGENALQFGLPESPWALSQIATQTRGWASGTDRMHAVTLLRLDDGFARKSSLVTLRRWLATL
uniref:Beta-amylase n=1 Tax=Zooxanthella nutricula TaxID=1333877 RepID=A0A7S2NIA4_9DINO